MKPNNQPALYNQLQHTACPAKNVWYVIFANSNLLLFLASSTVSGCHLVVIEGNSQSICVELVICVTLID